MGRALQGLVLPWGWCVLPWFSPRRLEVLLGLGVGLSSCDAVGWANGLRGSRPSPSLYLPLLLRAKGRASRCCTGDGGGGICCLLKHGGSFSPCPRWSLWPFRLRSPESQTHSGAQHSKAAAGVVVVLISPIWFIKRAGVQIFQYYLAFRSPQAFVFELQCVQEVSDNLRHLMLGCSANYTDVANNM